MSFVNSLHESSSEDEEITNQKTKVLGRRYKWVKLDKKRYVSYQNYFLAAKLKFS